MPLFSPQYFPHFEPDFPFSSCSLILFSWSGPGSWQFVQTEWLPSLQISAEVQNLSYLSCPLFCHFLGLSAVTEHVLPLPAIHRYEFNNCLSKTINIYTVSILTVTHSLLNYCTNSEGSNLWPDSKSCWRWDQQCLRADVSKGVCAVLKNFVFSSGNLRNFCVP